MSGNLLYVHFPWVGPDPPFKHRALEPIRENSAARGKGRRVGLIDCWSRRQESFHFVTAFPDLCDIKASTLPGYGRGESTFLLCGPQMQASMASDLIEYSTTTNS